MQGEKASIFTAQQEADLRRLKAYRPYRIVFGAVKADTGEFVMRADATRHALNRYLRAGWLVATVETTAA